MTASVSAQQSKSGPNRPDGVDLGLRATTSSQVIIQGVPAYLWRHGCGPTAAGMVIGYWDSQGYPDLVPGDASTQTAAVDAMIADDGGEENCNNPVLNHYTDYACPVERSKLLPDKSTLGGEVHQNNCLADFMLTSRSSERNKYGWSWFIHVARAFTGYVKLKYPEVDVQSKNIYWAYFSWEDYKEEIDNNRPVVLLVDTRWYWGTDHFVTGIGYNDETMEYGIYDTWDHEIHWYRWHQNGPGENWGVYGVTTLSLPTTGDPLQDQQAVGGYAVASAPDGQTVAKNSPYGVPGKVELCANYPNPFNPSTDISFSLPHACHVKLEVFNIMGQRIETLVDRQMEAGEHTVSFDGGSKASGMYLYRLTTDESAITKKMLLVK